MYLGRPCCSISRVFRIGLPLTLNDSLFEALEKNPPCLRNACDVPLDGLRMVHPPHPVSIIRGFHHIREFQ